MKKTVFIQTNDGILLNINDIKAMIFIGNDLYRLVLRRPIDKHTCFFADHEELAEKGVLK